MAIPSDGRDPWLAWHVKPGRALDDPANPYSIRLECQITMIQSPFVQTARLLVGSSARLDHHESLTPQISNRFETPAIVRVGMDNRCWK